MHTPHAVAIALTLVFGGTVLLLVLGLSVFYGRTQPVRVATSTPVTAATTTLPAVPVPLPIQKDVPVAPVATPKPVPTPPSKPPVVVTPPSIRVGTTTLAIRSIPLLTGGTVHAGEWVPISYLQITNVGQEGALLKGFSIQQNGSAPGEVIIGLSTIDDRGGSKGSVGGNEAATPFANGVASVPTDAYFAPGQERLFTIKAMVSHQVSSYIGMQLVLVVSSVASTATIQGSFPVAGTTWTIVE